MEISTRLMEKSEAQEVLKIARRAFSVTEMLGVPKPKQAIVAVIDGKIVGAIQFKFYAVGGKKIGYYEYAFIDPDYHNQGVGNVLYSAVAEYLWAQDCKVITALVKDDNVGSWSLLMKNGFARISLLEVIRQFGILGALRLYFGSMLGIAIGMDYYVALPGQKCSADKGGSVKQIAAYLFANFLLFFCMLFQGVDEIGLFFAAYVTYLLGGIMVGYVGTLFSKRKWQFRLCNGGGLVCILVTFLGSVFPMIGNWYPERYEKSAGFRRDLGIQALIGWLFVLVLSVVSLLLEGQHIVFAYLSQVGSILLLYRVLAIYPFESFGGGRVCRWSKGIYLLMAVGSITVFAFA